MLRIRSIASTLTLAAIAVALGAVPAHAGHGVASGTNTSTMATSMLGASTLAIDGSSAPALEALSATASASDGLTALPCEDGMAGPYPCKDVDLESFVPLPALGGATGNDIWGWTDPETGRDYAVMGTSHTTGFVDVTDPQDPILVGTLPTEGIPDWVLWRDVKVFKDHAFIISEVSGSGLQVFDLTRLRDYAGAPMVFTSDVHDTSDFDFAHNIHINEATGFAYVIGSDACHNGTQRGGLLVIDVNDPKSPQLAGCGETENDPATPANEAIYNYVHDVECVIYEGPDPDYQGREICSGSNEEAIVLYDATDKDAIEVISMTPYPTAAYAHQGDFTDDQRWFLFGDELDEQEGTVSNTTTYIMDMSDLDTPGTPVPFSHASKSIDHNMYIHGNRVFQANYMEGLRILEFDDASLAAGQLSEIAFFDVVPGADVAEFAGTWSNYRFDSGIVVLSAIENEANGLFVLKPDLPADNNGGGNGGGKDKGKKPGKGCGDKNHEHEREHECKKQPK